jgi:hypothetical protein
MNGAFCITRTKIIHSKHRKQKHKFTKKFTSSLKLNTNKTLVPITILQTNNIPNTQITKTSHSQLLISPRDQ